MLSSKRFALYVSSRLSTSTFRFSFDVPFFSPCTKPYDRIHTHLTSSGPWTSSRFRSHPLHTASTPPPVTLPHVRPNQDGNPNSVLTLFTSSGPWISARSLILSSRFASYCFNVAASSPELMCRFSMTDCSSEGAPRGRPSPRSTCKGGTFSCVNKFWALLYYTSKRRGYYHALV
jgi:hypothetical protein